MDKGRLEAFSDGVIAIIITIMVLELKVPHGDSLQALKPLIPVFISYVLSFVYIGIYWNNHHHMFQVVKSVNGFVLWANLHLLFWMSLVPFVTAWMGENNFTKWPTIFYGISLIMCGVAYRILVISLIRHEGENSLLAEAVGNDFKGRISVVIYAIAIALAWVNPCISFVLYGVVACVWFIPDRRIEKKVIEDENNR
ncbi:TMEM175 family protein [Mucilaginibacter sp. X5P1]|uniref:TMEM175 family protein n=1 Tax=Mucilaginibacter sp. X5P1 TaxID=2723088 RepID=UPI001616F765|nr:TMEM175 family protein [Mucilaginibacter sp. X5P1]MBB6138131.1 putative membrane protein [Mucilaginibacter sp. X5P1]